MSKITWAVGTRLGELTHSATVAGYEVEIAIEGGECGGTCNWRIAHGGLTVSGGESEHIIDAKRTALAELSAHFGQSIVVAEWGKQAVDAALRDLGASP